jgi:hypothetical protein
MVTDPFVRDLIASRVTERKVRSNAEGMFELKLLNPGRYRLQIEHPGYTSEWAQNLVVVEGQVADAGSIGLHGGGTVRGKVLDGAGKGLPRAVVRMFSGDDQYQARTDQEGRYVIEHVKPGLYRLSAQRSSGAPGGGDPFDDIVEQQNSEQQVQVIEGQVVDRDLQLGT